MLIGAGEQRNILLTRKMKMELTAFNDRESQKVNDDISCSVSVMSVAEMMNEAEEQFEKCGEETRKVNSEKKDKSSNFSVSSYMSSREMTPVQEMFNAWTIVPASLYCLYFLLFGKWLSEENIQMAQLEIMNKLTIDSYEQSQFGCIINSIFPNLYALPPFPLIVIALGCILHAPFSFLYHWNCATILPPGMARIDHWSRRMDHCMIHVASALWSYGTSGRWDYFLVNAVYNLDCAYRQFLPKINPKRNKICIFISIVGYTIPLLRIGCFGSFFALWATILFSGWLFACYPIKGWSHSAFHLIFSLVPHFLLVSSCYLSASQPQIKIAAYCASMVRVENEL